MRYRTEYVDIAPLTDAPVCAGTLQMIDDHVGHLLELLDVELSGRIPLYLVHPGDPEPDPWCREWLDNEHAAGCFIRGTIYTGMFGVPHELVHAVTVPAWGRSWWAEGVAYAFSGYTPVPEWMPPDTSTEEQWLDRRGRSGHFVRWLIETHGGGVFMELYTRTPRNAELAEVDAVVQDVLGVGFAELLSEYAAQAPYVYPDRWACYVGRDAVESPWTGDSWTHSVTLDCDQANTFSNGDLEQPRMSARIPLTIPRAGRYRFIADRPDAELLLQPCLTAPSTVPIPDALGWPDEINPLVGAAFREPGPHVLVVNVPVGAPSTVRVASYLSIGDLPYP